VVVLITLPGGVETVAPVVGSGDISTKSIVSMHPGPEQLAAGGHCQQLDEKPFFE
jgi:hypothetical protein